MSSTSSLAPGPAARRRRVRSGCLTCRGRRRKCDEAKPTCNACLTRNLPCRYENKLRFVHTASVLGRDGPTLVQTSPSAHEPAAIAQENVETESSIRPWTSPTVLTDTIAVATPTHGHNTPPQQNTSVPTTSTAQVTSPFLAWASHFQTPRESHGQSCSSSLSELDVPRCKVSGYRNVAELDMLSLYRYHVGPVLDLDPMEAYWSSELLHQSVHCSRLSEAIINVSKCIQERMRCRSFGAIESDRSLTTPETQGSQDVEFPVQLLLAWRSMMHINPSKWLDFLYTHRSFLMDGECPAECRGWRLRLILASELATDQANSTLIHRVVSPSYQFEVSRPPAGSKAQLHNSCEILCRAVAALKDTLRPTTNLPIGSIWQSCWSASQIWYATRTVEMQQILELTHEDVSESMAGTASIFPPIIFSNHSATLANVAHHLSSILLLQAKPRLTSAAAERGSSVSLGWHVLRIQRIGSAAVEDGFWDPLLAIAVIRAGKSLSHSSQLGAVAEVLRKLMANSGMQLQNDLEWFSQAAQA